MLRGLGHLLEAVHVAVLLAHGMRDDQEGGALEEDDLVRVAHAAQPLELRGERLSIRDERVHLVGVGVGVRVRVEVGVGVGGRVGVGVRVGARVRVKVRVGSGVWLGIKVSRFGRSVSAPSSTTRGRASRPRWTS